MTRKVGSKMSLKYYVTTVVYTIGGGEDTATLSEYNGKVKFAQHFERAWTEKLFDTEIDALTYLRGMYPDRTLTVFEDTGKIISTFGHESGMTTIKIRRERND